jgi:putative aminopeptidase FrvX
VVNQNQAMIRNTNVSASTQEQGTRDRERALSHLRELTQIPSASGREHRVIAWVKAWMAGQRGLVMETDAHGNITIRREREPAGRPVYFTAHLDHPAFVVEHLVAPNFIELTFLGGVMEEYFQDASLVVHRESGGQVAARIVSCNGGTPFKRYTAQVADATGIAPGDIAVWDVGPAEAIDGQMHTLACDDLAALAAAIAAYEALGECAYPVRLFLTRAEEIGLIGAIGACRERTIPMDARVIALENSRSFAESPIGGGPIVRVGDRMSVFSPGLTDAVAKVAESIAGAPSTVTAGQKISELPAWKWQRKLMAGGACEASAYCAYGYEATCVCLPLGNYHNMADLAAVQEGTNTQRPRVAREFIGIGDYQNLVDLLVACGTRLPDSGGVAVGKFEKLWEERRWVVA